MNHNITSTTSSPFSSISSPFFDIGNELGDLVVMDFAIIMFVAALMMVITRKIKQPMVIGLIIAGMLIGPYTPPFQLVSSIETINLLAEIGIIILLFAVGTEFPMARLKSIGRKALVIALSEALGTFALGYFVGQQMGLPLFDSLFLALSISVTSTVIVMRVLEELGMLRDDASFLLLGVAVLEDIIIISMLAVLQSVAEVGEVSFGEIAVSLGLVIAFIGAVLFIGSRTVPKLIDKVGRTSHYEFLLVAILGVAFGLSYIANLIGISVATGAFFAGVLVAGSKSQSVAKIISTPLKDMFAAIFFVSVGALMDVKLIPLFIVPALILIATSLSAKFGTVFLSARLLGVSNKTAIRAGFGLSASGGELALVSAKGGADVGATSAHILPMVGAMTIMTTFLSPYVIKLGWRISNLVVREDKDEAPQESKDRDSFKKR